MNKLAAGGLMAFVMASVTFVGAGFAGGADASASNAAESAGHSDEVTEDDRLSEAETKAAHSRPGGSNGHDEVAEEPAAQPSGSLLLPPQDLPALPTTTPQVARPSARPPAPYNPWSTASPAVQARAFVEAVVAQIEAAAVRIETAGSPAEARAILASVDRTIRGHKHAWEDYQRRLSPAEKTAVQQRGQTQITALVMRLTAAMRRARLSPDGLQP